VSDEIAVVLLVLLLLVLLLDENKLIVSRLDLQW
jgi:hypothetical protein